MFLVFKHSCFLCKKKFRWNKKSGFTISATSYGDVITTNKICDECGNTINEQYDIGEKILSIVPTEKD